MIRQPSPRAPWFPTFQASFCSYITSPRCFFFVLKSMFINGICFSLTLIRSLSLFLFRSRSLIVPARRAIKNSKFYACQKSRNNKANRMKTIRNEWKKRNKEQKTIHLLNSSTHVFNNFLRLVVPFLFKWLRRSVVAVKHSKTKQKNSSERKTANNKFIAFDRCLVPLYMTESKKKSRREQAPFVTFVMWLRTQILEMRKWVLKINDSTGNIDVTRWLLRVF